MENPKIPKEKLLEDFQLPHVRHGKSKHPQLMQDVQLPFCADTVPAGAPAMKEERFRKKRSPELAAT